MRKARDLMGIPILVSGSGERLGEIQDLSFDPVGMVVTGFLLAKGNWLHPAKQVSMGALEKVETDAVKVHKSIDACAPGLHYVSELTGKKVITLQGKELGSVQDVVLDDCCRQVIGYEISDGFINDLVSGRAIVHRPSVLSQTDYCLVVEDKLENIWEIRT